MTADSTNSFLQILQRAKDSASNTDQAFSTNPKSPKQEYNPSNFSTSSNSYSTMPAVAMHNPISDGIAETPSTPKAFSALFSSNVAAVPHHQVNPSFILFGNDNKTNTVQKHKSYGSLASAISPRNGTNKELPKIDFASSQFDSKPNVDAVFSNNIDSSPSEVSSPVLSLDAARELKEIRKLLKKLHLDEMQHSMRQVEEEKILMSLEEKLVNKIDLVMGNRFDSLFKQMENRQEEEFKLEHVRMEKLLKFISENLNKNMAELVYTSIKKEMQNSLKDQLPTIMGGFISKNLPVILKSLLETHMQEVIQQVLPNFVERIPFEKVLTPQFEAALAQHVAKAMGHVLNSTLVPALTDSVQDYLGRTEAMHSSQISLLNEKADTMMASIEKASKSSSRKDSHFSTGFSPENVAKIDLCLTEGRFSEALIRCFYVGHMDTFVSTLGRIPLTLDLADLSLARLLSLLDWLRKGLLELHGKTLYPWIEETLVGIDIALENGQGRLSTEYKNVLLSVQKLLISKKDAIIASTGATEKAIRLNLCLVQSILAAAENKS